MADVEDGGGSRFDDAVGEDHDYDPDFEKQVRIIRTAISELCQVMIIGRGTASARLRIYGTRVDVDISWYLLDICINAMQHACKKNARDWALLKSNRRSRERLSFLTGMAERLRERLLELAWARHKATSSALVPAKDAMIRRKMEADGFRFKVKKGASYLVFDHAYEEGYKEGEHVALSQAVGQDRGSADRLGAQER